MLPLTESGHHAAFSYAEEERKHRKERARGCALDREDAGALLEPESLEFALPCGLVQEEPRWRVLGRE